MKVRKILTQLDCESSFFGSFIVKEILRFELSFSDLGYKTCLMIIIVEEDFFLN